MPESPEIDALVDHLERHALGAFVVSARLGALNALRTVDPPLEAIVGAEVEDAARRGKYLLIRIGGVTLACHFARAGWLAWHESLPARPVRPGKGPVALRVSLGDHGFDLTEAGTKKSLAVWLARDPGDLEVLSGLGPEAGDLTADALEEVLREAGRKHLKTVLTDQRSMAGLGNGLSDEVAHRAKLSPYAPSNGLGDDGTARVHQAIGDVLAEFGALRGLAPGRVKTAKKALMRVHGREGQACPVCGTTIASVSFADSSLQYCPGCQTGGRKLSDRRMDRLLK